MDFVTILSGGSTQSIGKANEVIKFINHQQHLFNKLVGHLYNDDPVVCIRVAHVAEKITRDNPKLIQPHKSSLLSNLSYFDHHTELLMHIPLLLGRLQLEKKELIQVVDKMLYWLTTIHHKFTKVNCLQGLADQALKHEWLQKEVIAIIENEMEKGSASIKARGRILLKKLNT